MINLIDYKDLIYNIIGAAMRVHSELGFGLLEPLYNECLQIELADDGIVAESEKDLPCFYKGRKLKKSYRMDMVVCDNICIEFKSVEKILPEHRLQLFNYLRLTQKPIGMIINFGNRKLQGERYYYNADTNECTLLNKDMSPIYNNIDL